MVAGVTITTPLTSVAALMTATTSTALTALPSATVFTLPSKTSVTVEKIINDCKGTDGSDDVYARNSRVVVCGAVLDIRSYAGVKELIRQSANFHVYLFPKQSQRLLTFLSTVSRRDISRPLLPGIRTDMRIYPCGRVVCASPSISRLVQPR